MPGEQAAERFPLEVHHHMDCRIIIAAGHQSGQAWYHWFAAASPDRDNEVYLSAIEVTTGTSPGSTWTGR